MRQKLRGKAHLQITDALSKIVLCQLTRHPLQGLTRLQRGTGVGEAREVLTQVRIALFEDQLTQPLIAVGGQRYTALTCQIH